MFSITPLFVLIFIVMNIVTILPIGPHRLKVGIPYWGGEEKLDRLVRGHGNFIEVVPLFLISQATAEYLGVANFILWIVGILMIFSRVIHYVGMVAQDNPLNKARLIGTLLSLTSMAVLAITIGLQLITGQ